MLGEGGFDTDLAPAERARALALGASVLRNLGRVDAILNPWLTREPPLRVRNALRLAATELLAENTAPHAAVDAAVRLVEASPRTRHLKGLTNAVARRLTREGAALWEAQVPGDLTLTGPLRARIETAWGPEAAQAIARAHAAGAPLDLTPRDPAQAAALAERLGATLLPGGSLRLPRGGQVSALSGYDEGAWWVQDTAAAMPVRLLGDVAGLTALDLCAAPGGKTLQLAAGGARVTALDISEPRLARLHENLARTGLPAEVIIADAMDWAPAEPFDIVLVDAPCSATGTIRRHPDLPFLKSHTDLRSLTRLQDRMLARSWDWVKPGGRLVFCTCSLFPEEGEARLDRFLARHPEAEALPVPALDGIAPGWAEGAALRLRPDYWAEAGGMDGFFASVIRRGG
ncbi:methyltransferase domain-containing protein [Paroceanicella profunda]|uniref:Methyltransferase domain-containing protein n=2 Tax=Paroceanicella profunda TaxID=2579971 RepID=A0A5B8FXK1_9RHOB|nr:methyltransferase domain-containing protein [Paroceanicella profunda]